MKYCPECANKLEDTFIDGLERRACRSPGCGFVHWNNPLPVVAAIVQHQNNIILARNVKWPSGLFSLITGFLESQETPEQAVIREVQEELGLDAQIGGFIGHYSFFKMNQLILAFWVTATGTVKIGDEIAEVEFISRQNLKPERFAKLALTAAIVKDWLAQTA